MSILPIRTFKPDLNMTSNSTIDKSIPPLEPTFDPTTPGEESEHLQQVIKKLALQLHVEGGYFVETDRDSLRIPNPFTRTSKLTSSASSSSADSILTSSRNASTTIFYLLTPKSSLGGFHRNRGRTVHTLHRGRGRYVLIHADEVASTTCPGGYGGAEEVSEEQRWIGKARVETFVVGHDVLKGERLQWIVGMSRSAFSGTLLIERCRSMAGSTSHHTFCRTKKAAPAVKACSLARPSSLASSSRTMISCDQPGCTRSSRLNRLKRCTGC